MKLKEDFFYVYDAAIKYASAFGSPLFVLFAIAVLFALKQNYFAFMLLGLSVVFMIIEYSIKASIKDKRPDFKYNKTKSSIGMFEQKHSFPSGHSGQISIFTTLVNLVYHNIYLTAVFSVMMVLVGVSRIYTKRHRIEDVVGGYLIGIFLSILAFCLF